MENATKALVMAASILIGILIITLMMILFKSGAGVGKSGEKEISRIEIEEFNVHFSQYIGKELTIYDVVSINNFIQSCPTTYGRTVTISGAEGSITKDSIKSADLGKTYTLQINDYTDGFVSKITIN